MGRNINNKIVSADEAVACVRSGDHIHLSSIASVPHILVNALCRRAKTGDLCDLHFHHFHTEGPAPYSDPEYSGIFFDQGFFVEQMSVQMFKLVMLIICPLISLSRN